MSRRVQASRLDDGEQKNSSSGFGWYVATGLAGIAVGLLGSVLLDKAFPEDETEESAHKIATCDASTSSKKCEHGKCSICLEQVECVFQTPCCKQYIHGECQKQLMKHETACPLCRRQWK